MKSISAVVITFNEDQNIERCLRSLENVVDEIIILDSFSTDSTPEIVKSFDVKWIQRKWEGYSKSKNFANSLAKYDIIFSIDADETLSEELKQSLLVFKKQNEFELASLNRLNNYCGSWIRHCGWYPDKKVRIFNRQKVKWQGEIHETLTISEQEKIYHLQGDLLHYSYYSKEGHLKQIEKFTDVASHELYKSGKRTNQFMPYFSGIFKFVKSYFFQLGFLDGFVGYLVCKRTAYSSYLKYFKILQLQKNK